MKTSYMNSNNKCVDFDINNNNIINNFDFDINNNNKDSEMHG